MLGTLFYRKWDRVWKLIKTRWPMNRDTEPNTTGPPVSCNFSVHTVEEEKHWEWNVIGLVLDIQKHASSGICVSKLRYWSRGLEHTFSVIKYFHHSTRLAFRAVAEWEKLEIWNENYVWGSSSTVRELCDFGLVIVSHSCTMNNCLVPHRGRRRLFRSLQGFADLDWAQPILLRSLQAGSSPILLLGSNVLPMDNFQASVCTTVVNIPLVKANHIAMPRESERVWQSVDGKWHG